MKQLFFSLFILFSSLQLVSATQIEDSCKNLFIQDEEEGSEADQLDTDILHFSKITGTSKHGVQETSNNKVQGLDPVSIHPIKQSFVQETSNNKVQGLVNPDINSIPAEAALTLYFEQRANNLRNEAIKARENARITRERLDTFKQKLKQEEDNGASIGLVYFDLYISNYEQDVRYFSQQAIDYEMDAQEAEMLARYFEQQSSSD